MRAISRWSWLDQHVLQPSLRLVLSATDSIQQIEQPSKKASEQLPDRIAQMKHLHEAILAEYVRIIKRVSKLPPIIRWYRGVEISEQHEQTNVAASNTVQARPQRHAWTYFTWRYLVRVFVEAHIKRQLSTMLSAYTLEQQTASSDLTDKSREWLKEAEDSCSRFLGGLGS